MHVRRLFPALVLGIVTLVTLPQQVGEGTALAAKSSGPHDELAPVNIGAMPVPFTKNVGQWDNQVLYRANIGGATVWFCRDGITYQFTNRNSARGVDPGDQSGIKSTTSPDSPVSSSARDDFETMVVKSTFVNASPDVEILEEGLQEHRSNYFIGNDPSKWHTDVPNFTSITYRGINPGVDLRFEVLSGSLTQSSVAVSETQRGQFEFHYEQFDALHPFGGGPVEDLGRGQFRAHAPWGELVESTPADRAALSTYNNVDAADVDAVGSLIYSTYLGGNGSGSAGHDQGFDIAVDASGHAYVGAYTQSSSYPTLNPFQTDLGSSDVVVTKLNADGSSLVYSTYLGGSSGDAQLAGQTEVSIAVDGSGSAYIASYTGSADFPTLNAYQSTKNGVSDCFVTKLSPAGSSLIFSTFLGGNDVDHCKGMALDNEGNVYLAGLTRSTDFPTVDPFQATHQGGTPTSAHDGFVSKLGASGNTLIYSTYLGGTGQEVCYDIAVNASGNAYVTGNTYSTDFPTAVPFQATNNGGPANFASDAFVTKLNAAGNGLDYSTYLGGTDYDIGHGIAVDDGGNAYVTGTTSSFDFPIANAFYGTNGGNWDAFVTKLNNTGSALVYSTYFGGDGGDDGYAIAVDASSTAYLTGSWKSATFPTAGDFVAVPLRNSAFVTRFNALGTSLIYSTRLTGNSGSAEGYGIAVDATSNAYITGVAKGDFPTENPYQTDQEEWDAFVSKLLTNRPPGLDPIGPRLTDEGVLLSFATSASDLDGGSLVMSAEDIPAGSTYLDNGNGTASFSFTPDYTQADVYNVRFIVSDGVFSDTEMVQITVNNVNRAPALDPIGPQSVDEGTLLTFGASASDPDGPFPALSAADAPAGSVFVDNGDGTADFSLTPTPTQANIYEVLFIASDGLLADTENVTLTVNDVCVCDCHGDPSPIIGCDGQQDITDVVQSVNVAFRGAVAILDPNQFCPYERTDVDCTSSTDVLDVVKMVNVAFRGADVAAEFCNPCP